MCYRNIQASTMQLKRSDEHWVQGGLADLRSRLYWGLNEVLTPAVQALPAACAAAGASLHDPASVLPPTPRISSLLRVRTQESATSTLTGESPGCREHMHQGGIECRCCWALARQFCLTADRMFTAACLSLESSGF